MRTLSDNASAWVLQLSHGTYPGSGAQGNDISWAPTTHLHPGGPQPWQRMQNWPYPLPYNNMAPSSSMGFPFQTPGFNYGQGWGRVMPPPQPQWRPQDPAGRYFCGPHILDGRTRLAPVPLDPAQRLAWVGVITNSAAFASHDENANELASSEDLSNDEDKKVFAPSDEVSYPEYAEELVHDGKVLDRDDPGKDLRRLPTTPVRRHSACKRTLFTTKMQRSSNLVMKLPRPRTWTR